MLSKTTADYDHGHKWIRYQLIPSLRDYLMVWPDEPHIEAVSGEADGGWRFRSWQGLEAAVPLSAICCELQLGDDRVDIIDSDG